MFMTPAEWEQLTVLLHKACKELDHQLTDRPCPAHTDNPVRGLALPPKAQEAVMLAEHLAAIVDYA